MGRCRDGKAPRAALVFVDHDLRRSEARHRDGAGRQRSSARRTIPSQLGRVHAKQASPTKRAKGWEACSRTSSPSCAVRRSRHLPRHARICSSCRRKAGALGDRRALPPAGRGERQHGRHRGGHSRNRAGLLYAGRCPSARTTITRRCSTSERMRDGELDTSARLLHCSS